MIYKKKLKRNLLSVNMIELHDYITDIQLFERGYNRSQPKRIFYEKRASSSKNMPHMWSSIHVA